VNTNRFKGSLLGLALGDAFGAPFEGGILERACWAVIGKANGKHRFTDDTQMTIDVAKSLIAYGHIDQADLARRFAQSYRWSRGYGPGTARTLKLIRRGRSWDTACRSVYPKGSYGNGGAMRAPAVGLFYATASEQELIDAVGAATVTTHAHPLAVEGAVLIALATALAYKDENTDVLLAKLAQRIESFEFKSKLSKVAALLHSGKAVAPRSVALELGNGIAATESCVTALYIALAFRDKPFKDLLEFSLRLGGDVDTIAAMGCAIWGAFRGNDALPQNYLGQLEHYQRISALAEALADAAATARFAPSVDITA
jgi:poly(ADP-ribose) glycohydrolase ARH3